MRLRILALALIPFSAHAQVARDSIIAVTASRTSRLVPDRASLFVIVEGTAETAADAVARVDTKLKGVTDALRGFATRADVDRPISYSVGPTTNPIGYPVVQGAGTNTARAVIRVSTTRTDQISGLVAAALGSGAVNSSSLTFESSVADSVRRTRIAEVLNAAKGDAEALAQALGGHLGAVVDVSTNGGGPTFNQPTYIVFDNRFNGGQSSAPEVIITTSVTVRYRLLR